MCLSVSTGNIDFFRRIAQAFPELLNYYDSDGMTPLLSSIFQQETEIYKELAAVRERDVCDGPSDTLKTLRSQFDNYTQSSCISNMTLTHFLAAYGNMDLIM